jgi:folate-binding protein YgfZ
MEVSMDQEIYQRLRAGQSGTLLLRDRALWRLNGPDRVRYLNGQVTNDVAVLAPGRACYAAVTTAKGRMVGDLFIGAGPEALYLDFDAAYEESIQGRLEKYLVADDAAFEKVEGWSLAHVFGAQPPEIPAGTERFSNPRFGLSGWDVWSPPGKSFSMGAQVGADVAEILRIEHGLARWGADMGEDTLPPEAGLDRHGIRYDKGCYVGQETIARIKSIGHVNRELKVLCVESGEAEAGADLLAEGKTAGKLTSVAMSPALQKGIALGYVHRQHAQVGAVLTTARAVLTVIEPPLSFHP